MDREKQDLMLMQIHEKQDSLAREITRTQALLESHAAQEDRLWKAIEDIRDEQSKANSHLAEYNTQLSVHIAGVMELRKMNELLQKQVELNRQEVDIRLGKIEEPRKWLATTKKYLLWVAAVFGAIVAISGGLNVLLPFLSKLFIAKAAAAMLL